MKGFKQFILRGNVVDLAVGVVIGAAFTTIVKSLVDNIITPFISAVIKSPDFSDLSFTINGSHFQYGNLLNATINFLIVAGVVYFFIVKPINALIARTKKEAPLDPTTKKCPECISEIPIEAKKCAFCTSTVS